MLDRAEESRTNAHITFSYRVVPIVNDKITYLVFPRIGDNPISECGFHMLIRISNQFFYVGQNVIHDNALALTGI